MPPSPSSARIALYDDRRRRPIGEPEMQFCWDFLRGRCQRFRCRYKHVKDDDAPKRAAVSSASALLSQSLISLGYTATIGQLVVVFDCIYVDRHASRYCRCCYAYKQQTGSTANDERYACSNTNHEIRPCSSTWPWS